MSQVWTGSGITCLSDHCKARHPFHQGQCKAREDGQRCECREAR